MLTCITQSPEETAHLAGTIGKIIREGTVICLDGELGVGKTLFVRALARTLGVESDVTSPTFNLMNIYEAACPIVHFDLYRLNTEEELEDIGFYEYAEAQEGIVLIEWAEKFPDRCRLGGGAAIHIRRCGGKEHGALKGAGRTCQS